jgi:hypothetical protein
LGFLHSLYVNHLWIISVNQISALVSIVLKKKYS